MVQPLLGDHIELEIVLDPNLWSVKADPSQMEQVLANLTINARDAMPEGGKLTVETNNIVLDEAYAHDHLDAEPGRYVLLSVSDTGVGMSEAVKKRIFEPFFTTKEAGKGTGLGLATVFGVIRQSNGHIWVYSEPDQGATFKIYLPQAAESTVPLPSFEVTTPLPQGTETILLVEDEHVVRDLAAAVLARQGYTVLTAANGQKAWTMIHQLNQPIDLLLTDLVMPKVGGQALAQQLREIQPDLKVIFISGYTNHTVMQQLKVEAGTAFIQKPFSPATLARKVREVLDSGQ
jgi:CheY-like chemotaxis protein